jgi:hypothetical protein
VPAIVVSAPGEGGRLACGLAGAAEAMALQSIPDGVLMDAQLVSHLNERPRALGHAIGQVCPKVSEAELGGALGEALVGGAAALAGAADLRWGAVDAGLVDEAADHVDGGVQLAGELGQAGVLPAARHQVTVKAGESQGVGAVVEAALLAVDDGEAARDL